MVIYDWLNSSYFTLSLSLVQKWVGCGSLNDGLWYSRVVKTTYMVNSLVVYVGK